MQYRSIKNPGIPTGQALSLGWLFADRERNRYTNGKRDHGRSESVGVAHEESGKRVSAADGRKAKVEAQADAEAN